MPRLSNQPLKRFGFRFVLFDEEDSVKRRIDRQGALSRSCMDVHRLIIEPKKCDLRCINDPTKRPRSCKRINVDAFEWQLFECSIEEANIILDHRGLYK